MSLKLLDIEYLRSQKSNRGQVLVTGSMLSVCADGNLVVVNGNVGVGTGLPTSKLTIIGNVAIRGSSALIFPDNSIQTTAATTATPSGTDGSVQYKSGNSFAGSSDLYWNQPATRLGIGTNSPRSTLQIKDVGYESTNTFVGDLSETVLDSFPVPDYRSCHYIVQVTDENFSWFHTAQIMLVHDGMQAFKSEYNIVTTQERLGTFDCRVNNGNVELMFLPLYSSSKNIKVIRTSIEP